MSPRDVDRLADPPRRGERVRVDRLGARSSRAGAAVVVGLPAVDDLLGDPRRERLVEPDVVPPRGRHQVAEPLVRDLVRADVRGAVAEARRRRVRLREQHRGMP